MEEIKQKLNYLISLLDEKKTLLIQILNITENQELFCKQLYGETKESFLKDSLKEKQILISKISIIDNTFITTFNSFNGDLNKNSSLFKDTLFLMKQKIKQITDLDIKIRLKENNNKIFFNQTTIMSKPRIIKSSKTYIINEYAKNSKK